MCEWGLPFHHHLFSRVVCLMIPILFPILVTILTLGGGQPKPHKICHQEVVRVYLYAGGEVVGFQDRGVKVCEVGQ